MNWATDSRSRTRVGDLSLRVLRDRTRLCLLFIPAGELFSEVGGAAVVWRRRIGLLGTAGVS